MDDQEDFWYTVGLWAGRLAPIAIVVLAIMLVVMVVT